MTGMPRRPLAAWTVLPLLLAVVLIAYRDALGAWFAADDFLWLSSSNFLVDRGIATAAEMGVFGPEGTWLIEGRGVEPDVVVDNLPHATFGGKDAQLDAAIDYLKKQIQEHPVVMPQTPKFPDKSFHKEGVK